MADRRKIEKKKEQESAEAISGLKIDILEDSVNTLLQKSAK